MDIYYVKQSEDRLEVGETPAGRLVGAAMRFALWAPVAMLGLSIVFMPDYLCHYREQAAAGAVFWFSVALGGCFIGAVGGFVKFSRRDTWTFDVSKGELVFRAEPMVGQSAEASVPLGKWRGVVGRPAGLFAVSTISVRLADGPEETLCESRLGWSGLASTWQQVETFVRDYDLDVEVERHSA